MLGLVCWYLSGSSSNDYQFLGNNKVWYGIDAMHDSSLNTIFSLQSGSDYP